MTMEGWGGCSEHDYDATDAVNEAKQEREAVLLPCQCGKPAFLEKRKGMQGVTCGAWYRERVYCRNKKCGLTTATFKKPNAAIAAWNTRAQTDALKIARDALLAELETPSVGLVCFALAAWREHLRFHTTGDENGEPVFKSTSREAMAAAIQAVAAYLKEQSK